VVRSSKIGGKQQTKTGLIGRSYVSEERKYTTGFIYRGKRCKETNRKRVKLNEMGAWEDGHVKSVTGKDVKTEKKSAKTKRKRERS